MSIADIPQIQRLTETQRAQLVHELAATLPEKEQFALAAEIFERFPPPGEPLTEEELHRVIEERWAAYEADPSIALTVEEFTELMKREREC